MSAALPGASGLTGGPATSFDPASMLASELGGLMTAARKNAAAASSAALAALHQEAAAINAAAAAATPAGAAGAPAASAPAVRPLGQGDTRMLLQAIHTSPEECARCIDSLSAQLGFDSAQREEILRLAQTLSSSRDVVASARASLAQEQRNHSSQQRNLSNLQRQLGIDPSPGSVQPRTDIGRDIGYYHEGQGADGALGEGHTLPSPAQRAALIASNKRLELEKSAAAAAAGAAAAAAATAVADGDGPDESEALASLDHGGDDYDDGPEGGSAADAAGAVPAMAGSFDGRKKIDASSRFDYSEQEKDLSVIRQGGVGFATRKLDLNSQPQVDPLKAQREQNERDHFTSMAAQVLDYFGVLDLSKARSTNTALKNSRVKDTNAELQSLPSVISVFNAMNENRSNGLPPGAGLPGSTPAAASGAAAAAGAATAAPAGQVEDGDDFAFDQVDHHGYQVGSEHHLGAQFAGTVSLENNDASNLGDHDALPSGPVPDMAAAATAAPEVASAAQAAGAADAAAPAVSPFEQVSPAAQAAGTADAAAPAVSPFEQVSPAAQAAGAADAAAPAVSPFDQPDDSAAADAAAAAAAKAHDSEAVEAAQQEVSQSSEGAAEGASDQPSSPDAASASAAGEPGADQSSAALPAAADQAAPDEAAASDAAGAAAAEGTQASEGYSAASAQPGDADAQAAGNAEQARAEAEEQPHGDEVVSATADAQSDASSSGATLELAAGFAPVSLSAGTAQDEPAAPAAPVKKGAVRTDNARKALKGIASNLADDEGFDALETSVDDIMGTSYSDLTISEMPAAELESITPASAAQDNSAAADTAADAAADAALSGESMAGPDSGADSAGQAAAAAASAATAAVAAAASAVGTQGAATTTPDNDLPPWSMGVDDRRTLLKDQTVFQKSAAIGAAARASDAAAGEGSGAAVSSRPAADLSGGSALSAQIMVDVQPVSLSLSAAAAEDAYDDDDLIAAPAAAPLMAPLASSDESYAAAGQGAGPTDAVADAATGGTAGDYGAAGAAAQAAAGDAAEGDDTGGSSGFDAEAAAQPGAAMDITGLAQDSRLVKPDQGVLHADGTTDVSPEDELAQEAAARLSSLAATARRTHNSDEHKALEQSMGQAALDTLGFLEAKIAKNIELSGTNSGPSPWDLMNMAQVINIDNAEFKVQRPKLEKLTRMSDNNFLMAGNDESAEAAVSRVFTGTLLNAWGKPAPDEGTMALMAWIEVKVKEAAAGREQSLKAAQDFARRMAAAGQQVEVSSDPHKIPLSLLQLLAATDSALAEIYQRRRATEQPAQPAAHAAPAAAVAAAAAPGAGAPVGAPATGMNRAMAPQGQTGMPGRPGQPGFQGQPGPQGAGMPPGAQGGWQGRGPGQGPGPGGYGQMPVQPQGMTGGRPGPGPGGIPDDMPGGAPSGGMAAGAMPPDYGGSPDDFYDDYGYMQPSAVMPDYGSFEESDGYEGYMDAGSSFAADLALSQDPEFVQAVPVDGTDTVMGTAVAVGGSGDLPGWRRNVDDDYLEAAGRDDDWYELIVKAYPQHGLEYSTLVRSGRRIDEKDPCHWYVVISRNDEFSTLGDAILPKMEKRLSEVHGSPVHLEVVTEDNVPREAPAVRAYYAHQEDIARARQDCYKIRGLGALLRDLGEDLANTGIEIYQKVQLPPQLSGQQAGQSEVTEPPALPHS